jgi:hypothetical protein
MVDAIKNLDELSRKLNHQSEKINSIITTLNAKLAALNLGVEVWLENHPLEHSEIRHRADEQDCDVMYHEGRVLGYCRIDDNWELALKKCWYDFGEEGEERQVTTVSDSETPLLKASRINRIKGLELLPDLLEKIKDRGEEMLEAIESAERVAEKL